LAAVYSDDDSLGSSASEAESLLGRDGQPADTVAPTCHESDPALEEQAEYRNRIGRWKRETLSTISDWSWWAVVSIATAAHEPLTHHFNFINSLGYKSTQAALVCGKAQAILLEFGILLSNPVWAERTVDGAPVNQGNLVPELLRLGVQLTFNHHAGYFRRIFKPTVQLPLSLFWLSHLPGDSPCRRRQQVCQEVIDTPYGKLEINSRKLKHIALGEFEQGAADGTVGPLLFSVISSWEAGSKADVRVNEGHNSLLKSTCDRNSNIGLPLLSSRVNCKKELGVGVRGASTKWTRQRPQALAVLHALGL
jgi:hypothetical protein